MNISIKFFFFTQMVAYCVHHSGHSFFYLVINPGDHSSECGSNSFYSIIWLLHSFTNCYILNENLSYLEFFVIIVDGKKKEISYNLQCIPSNIEINVFVGQIPRNGVNRLKVDALWSHIMHGLDTAAKIPSYLVIHYLQFHVH